MDGMMTVGQEITESNLRIEDCQAISDRNIS